MKMIQRVLPAILQVARKAGDVINDQFGAIGLSQPTRSGVAEKLVAETSFVAGDDFIHSNL